MVSDLRVRGQLAQMQLVWKGDAFDLERHGDCEKDEYRLSAESAAKFEKIRSEAYVLDRKVQYLLDVSGRSYFSIETEDNETTIKEIEID